MELFSICLDLIRESYITLFFEMSNYDKLLSSRKIKADRKRMFFTRFARFKYKSKVTSFFFFSNKDGYKTLKGRI